MLVHHQLPVRMIEEDIVTEHSDKEVPDEAVERRHAVWVGIKALAVLAVPAAVHQGEPHPEVEAHHLNALRKVQCIGYLHPQDPNHLKFV